MRLENNEKPDERRRALRPRARILRTLGEELISSETVAVIELVKNSYDADASFVTVEFKQSLDAGKGSIDINDDGHGMELSIVESAWMEPATNLKKVARVSAYRHRRLLGEKGIGRFATSRLAKELELITRAPGNPSEVYAYFDWSQFDNDEKYLDEILVLAESRTPRELVAAREVPVKTAPAGPHDLPRDGSHGTILRMTGLKRSWGSREIDDLRRGLGRLVSPFDEERDFRIFLKLPSDQGISQQELSAPDVIKHPHYEIEGDVSVDGAVDLKIRVAAIGEAVERISGTLMRSQVDQEITLVEGSTPIAGGEAISFGPLQFRILVWDRDQLESVDQKLGLGIKSIRKDLDSVAGISIYRDGFRVLPYGEPDNDWLRLDIRRVQNPSLRLSNNQLTGYIKIGADSNPELRDQSNREGLNNNRAYSDLQGAMLVVLSRFEAIRFSARRREKSADAGAAENLLGLPDGEALHKELARLHASPETVQVFDDATKKWEQQILRVREVLSRYHSLATLGQLIDKVVHDSRQPLSAIGSQNAMAREVIQNWLDENSKNSSFGQLLVGIDRRLERVQSAVTVLDDVLTRIEPLGGKRRGKIQKLYVEEIIKHAFSLYENETKSLGIKVALPKNSILVSVDSSELEQVILNLISNSVYWLATIPKERRAIAVECSRPQASWVEIVFADSGPGIAKKDRDSIFEPYFSTKPNGIGLGLVIAGEIVRDFYGGSFELMDSGPLGGAAFRIRLKTRV